MLDDALPVVALFVVQGEIQPFRFLLVVHAQAHNHVQDLEDDEAHDACVHHGSDNAEQLHAELAADAADAIAETRTTQRLRAKHAG